MGIIPFGMFHPDAAQVNAPVVVEARNCIPGVTSFLPLQSAVSSTSALGSAVRGAVSVLKDDGTVATFAGTETALYRLNASAGWDDVTRTVGGAYSVGTGEQWKFAAYGNNLLASNVNAKLQTFDVTSSTNFADISAAPKARYVDVIRDFVLVGAVFGNEKRIQWSANGDSTSWTPSVSESDYQDIPNGGPVRGLLGGEVAYVFQASRVTRMTYVPGSAFVMQLDEVEGGAGLAAPHSLIKLRNDAYYIAGDGPRKIALGSTQSTPIGVGKWAKWFLSDLKTGSELNIIGAFNPVRPHIVWSYISRDTSSATPNRMVIYDWTLDEATFADITAESLIKWLSPGVTLDTMGVYGNLDTLPFSLDSPFWKGGAAVLGLFGSDHSLSLLSGTPMAAQFMTGDGQGKGRAKLRWTTPKVDASGVTVAIAGRERQSDAVTFGPSEAMEETGDVPANVSGNLFRAKINIPAQTWSQLEGIDSDAVPQGQR